MFVGTHTLYYTFTFLGQTTLSIGHNMAITTLTGDTVIVTYL